MVPTFWIRVRQIRRYGKQLREYRVNSRKCASVMVPTFWMWVRKNRRYGRHLREYVVNMRKMCQCYGACFFNVGGTFRGYGR